MEELSLLHFLKSTPIDPSFEFHGNLQASVARMFASSVSATSMNTDEIGPIAFQLSKDSRVCSLEYEMCCPGRTINDAIVKVENEFPIIFSAIPTEEGGYEISLEYYERRFDYGQ